MTLWLGAALAGCVVVAVVVALARSGTSSASDDQARRVDGFIPAVEGEIPPRGWILVEVEGKGRFWADPTTLLSSMPKNELTARQVERIRAFKAIVGENDPTSLEEAIDNFSRDRNPDAEIAIWEHIAEVWSSEVAARGISDPSHARLLYLGVVGCSLVGPSPEALLAWNPGLKAVPDLAGLTARYRGDG